MSVPLWTDRTISARAVGSGQTGLVITCPLSGKVMGGIFSQAGSSGAVGISPATKCDRMNIPSELTMGMPNHPRMSAPTIKPTERERKE